MGSTPYLRRLSMHFGIAGLIVCTFLGAQEKRSYTRDRRSLLQEVKGNVNVHGLGLKSRPADGYLPACLEVATVASGSPAERAGVLVGDLVLSINGQPASSIKEFMTTLIRTRSQKVELVIQRGGSNLSLQLVGPQTSSAGSAADPFLVPGMDRASQSGPGINVLRRVFIDPRTGAVAFLGAYDPRFASGPIDYTTLLHDALRSPYPAFSLDPSPASKASRENLLRRVDEDMARVQQDLNYGKAWLLRIGNVLTARFPGLALDRQRFVKRGAEATGASPEQVKAFWKVATGQTPAMTEEWFAFANKLFEKMGSPEVGQAILTLRSDARAGMDMLGLGSMVDDMRQKIQAGSITREFGSAYMQAAFWEQVFLRLKVPESTYKAAVERVKAGREPLTTFLPTVESQLAKVITDRVMTPWINGLVLSQKFLEGFYKASPPEVVPSYLGGLVPDSELARTFFAADWSLKMLAISPELSEKVPGHLTYQNYEFRLASSRGTYASGSRGSIRAWLFPQSVDLRHDPTGSVVNFGPSHMAVRSELTSFEGGSRAASALEREAVASYAEEVTHRYDDYARALPDLHRLRESAKLLALVRWAKARNLNLIPPGPSVPGSPLPASFNQGFWTATLQTDANKFFFVISAHGGVDFDPKVGEAWVQPKEESGLAGSALEQLVGSAALAQQAADAALNGDLDAARDLAQRSEQAMIGDLRSGFPPLARISEVPEPTALAASQSEVVLRSQEAIAGLRQAKETAQKASGPDSAAMLAQAETARQKWEGTLREMKERMTQGRPQTPSAPRLVVQVRPDSPVVTPIATAAPSQQTQPQDVSVPLAEPARIAVPPAERARILGEIDQMRKELCRIQAQLRKFNTTIQSNQAQRTQWEAVTNEAYQRALDKVKDALLDELKDLTLDLPEGYLEEKLAAATSPQDKERVKRSLRLVQHLKESYALKDFSVWASYEDYSRDEIIEGAKMVAELTGLDAWIKNKLVKKWGLGRVIAFGEAAQDIVASAYDVTSEVLAWRRLNQLNRNSDSFLKAIAATSRHLQNVMEGIREREQKLGLPLGATKDPCP